MLNFNDDELVTLPTPIKADSEIKFYFTWELPFDPNEGTDYPRDLKYTIIPYLNEDIPQPNRITGHLYRINKNKQGIQTSVYSTNSVTHTVQSKITKIKIKLTYYHKNRYYDVATGVLHYEIQSKNACCIIL